MKTSSSSSSESSRSRSRRRRRLALGLAAGLAFGLVVPWTILVSGDGVRLVFAWGLVNPRPFVATTLPEYLGMTQGLPRRLLAWPVSSFCYACALASAALGAIGLEDRDVTAGLLALAGLSNGWFALGLLSRSATTPIPVAALVLVAAAAVTFFSRK